MADRHTPEQRSKNMRAIRSCGTSIEITFSRFLRKAGFGYRKHFKDLPGKPDFVLTKYRTVIFCDGEFWHGKDWETRRADIQSNQTFWHTKIERNMTRDKEVNHLLTDAGWKVLRFWGKDILKYPEACQVFFLECIRQPGAGLFLCTVEKPPESQKKSPKSKKPILLAAEDSAEYGKKDAAPA